MTAAIESGHAPNSPRALRGKRRLKALGIDPDIMDQAQIRQAYETYRQVYIDMAEAGKHFEPIRADEDPLSGACLHSRWGMLVQALMDAHGWTETPDGWSSHRVRWPTPEERRMGVRGR